MAAQLDPEELRRLATRHIDTADKRILLGLLAAAPARRFPLSELWAHVRTDQQTLVLLMDELECARLVRVERVGDSSYYRLAPLEGLADLILRLNRAASDETLRWAGRRSSR